MQIMGQESEWFRSSVSRHDRFADVKLDQARRYLSCADTPAPLLKVRNELNAVQERRSGYRAPTLTPHYAHILLSGSNAPHMIVRDVSRGSSPVTPLGYDFLTPE